MKKVLGLAEMSVPFFMLYDWPILFFYSKISYVLEGNEKVLESAPVCFPKYMEILEFDE